MTTCAFDALLLSLQDAVTDANASIRRRREALLAGGLADEAADHALRVRIPQTPATDAPCDLVSLPMSEFRDRRLPSIAMLSVEFDCRLRFRRQRGSWARVLTMTLGRPRFSWPWRRPPHHVRITYLSKNAWQAQVEIDGRLLELPLSTRLPGE